METFLAFTFFGGLIVLLVGAILFFIDYAQKRAKKKSLIIVAIGVVLTVLSLGSEILINQHNARVAQQQKEELAAEKKSKDKKFKNTASNFLAKYYVIWGDSEDLGNSVNKDWENAIDNDPEGFDVEKTIDDIESKNTDKITEITDGTDKLDTYLDTLKKNDTGKYSYEDFDKANDNISTLSNLVTSPSGSYSSFGTEFSDDDDAVSKSFDDIQKIVEQ
ncbi:hypothetical protein [Pediococcus pentosaceus]|uniref:hypothetical protein n=1 Tax=Pediococcus pentosaceus TaxID=1255 RepID=UPI001E473F29|nr:hypothetical protein [Pediococcus pentosaceus]MCG7196761.1 hypothetical protein [Pediococcus pentosaceus]MCI2396433.1 hypothetical protein [Pediococcus pentosaceus]